MALSDKSELDRIDALLSRCLSIAEGGLENEQRPLAILDCAEKLTRIKIKMAEADEMHKRNAEGAKANDLTINLNFNSDIAPLRQAD